MKKILLILFIFAFMGSVTSYADIYKYIDKDGREKFVDRMEAVPDQYRDQLKLHAKEYNFTTSLKAETVVKKSEKNVKIYVTSWCGYCRKLEGWLKKEGIKYSKYDVEKSAMGRQEFAKLGGGGVPVIKVGSKVIRGYAPDAIKRALE